MEPYRSMEKVSTNFYFNLKINSLITINLILLRLYDLYLYSGYSILSKNDLAYLPIFNGETALHKVDGGLSYSPCCAYGDGPSSGKCCNVRCVNDSTVVNV
jgi:hypothetical protein